MQTYLTRQGALSDLVQVLRRHFQVVIDHYIVEEALLVHAAVHTSLWAASASGRLTQEELCHLVENVYW